MRLTAVAMIVALLIQNLSWGATAGEPTRNELIIARDGATEAVIVVSPEAKMGDQLSIRPVHGSTECERFAAEDLARCIELMTGARPAIADSPEAIRAALGQKEKPVLLVGSEALKADAGLAKALGKVAKEDPILRADAIVVSRKKNRVYLAGLTDDGHYHAVAELLHRWGCRWYVPTEFGECIPEHDELAVGKLDYAYASPFEMRTYWISWNGSYEGYTPFKLRNRMTVGLPPISCGHALGPLTKEIVPEGKSGYEIPISDEKTAQHVAKKIIERFQKGDTSTASLSISDGVYRSDYERDVELRANLSDKYFLVPAMSDVFMTLYNRICEIVEEKQPGLLDDKRLGFLAYANMTIPPQRVLHAAAPLYCELAPIDIDPNHGMDDPWSPPRREYRETMYRWAEIMKRRVMIYDYDQGMLVWRDIPNPSHQAFQQDVKHYAAANILGLTTESRNAIATTFLNLHLRGQLMWNPDLDLEEHLAEFYPLFYGPAAEPMSRYWGTIFKAWEETIVTEHEFFAAPAIYTPELMAKLRSALEQGENARSHLRGPEARSRNEKRYLERMKFTRLSFEILDNYMSMVESGATHGDYERAHARGLLGLAKLKAMAEMNSTFTTRVIGRAALPDYGGSPAWWPGEVKLYEDLKKLTDGSEGRLIKTLPLEWAFRRDPNDTGLALGWGYQDEIDLSYWKEHGGEVTVRNRKDYPTTEWEMLRTDLYMQAQGVLHPDRQAFTGYAWYRTKVDLGRRDAKQSVHIRFPGLFAGSWLYCNGVLVAHRKQNPMWWRNSYAFNWDVDLSGHLKPGKNLLVLRNYNEHHVGGMFRRPFLYVPVGGE